MDRLAKMTFHLALGVALLSACSGPESVRVEPCLSVRELINRSEGLQAEQFVVDALGESRTPTLELESLTFADGAEDVFKLSDVRAYLGTFEGRVSMTCTELMVGGRLSDLPRIIAPIRDAFVRRGFAIVRETPGDLLSTSTDEPIRFQHYRRGDYFAGLGVEILAGRGLFRFDLCVESERQCRSPGMLKFAKDNEHLLDDLAPRDPTEKTVRP